MTAKFSDEMQAVIDGLFAEAGDWRQAAWQFRGKLLADMAKALDIPLDILDTPAAQHYSALLTGEPMTTQNVWFKLALKISASEATYRRLAENCIKSWDYPGAARWRATAEGLETARNYMNELAAQAREQIAEPPVGSATQPPTAGGIPIP